ncbi:MAG: hypothetical protein V3R22_00870 [Kiloniellales bacterium]
MTDKAEARSKEELVAAYKEILRSYIDLRPSGVRLKIADAIGKHKSFVSQIANPSYPVPVPGRHVSTIMDICHFSPEERETFLAAYRAAHPNQSRKVRPAGRAGAGHHTLHVEVPNFGDARIQREVENAIREFSRRIIVIAQKDES